MKTGRHRSSLRLKIIFALLISLMAVSAVSSYLRYFSYRQLLIRTLEAVGAIDLLTTQITSYIQSRILLSTGSIALTLVIVYLLMTRLVITRVEQINRAVKHISQGDLSVSIPESGDDEFTELAINFNKMADALREKDRLEERMRSHAEELDAKTKRLAALNTLAVMVSQSLSLQNVLGTALSEALEVMGLSAGWITLMDGKESPPRLASSQGLPEAAAIAHARCNWHQGLCAGVFASGRPKILRDDSKCTCPAAQYLRARGIEFRACVPLQAKERVLGVMSLVGESSHTAWVVSEDAEAMLTTIGRQIGIAVENASLYERLRQEQVVQRQLMERSINLQEEERRYVSRELHDSTGQGLTSMIMTLRTLERTSTTSEAQQAIRQLRETAASLLVELRNMALRLRPSVLDDLGLIAALREYVREYQSHYHTVVDFQVLAPAEIRLPPEIETGLFRIAQETLTNVARHAAAANVTVILEHRGDSVQLIVEDNGDGFDVDSTLNSHPHARNLGLHGMRERASLLGGTMTIESTPGMGATIFVRIPVKEGVVGRVEDTLAHRG